MEEINNAINNFVQAIAVDNEEAQKAAVVQIFIGIGHLFERATVALENIAMNTRS